MKHIKDLTRLEKIELLKCIEAGEIDPSELINDTFVIEKAGDDFVLLMTNATRLKKGLPIANGIAITPENREILKNFNEFFETLLLKQLH